MSHAEESGADDINEWIRPSAGGPDADVGALMQHLQTSIRTAYASATQSQPGETVIWSDRQGPAARLANLQSHIEHLLGSASIINGRLLQDPLAPQPRVQAFIRYSGLHLLGRIGRAIVLQAVRCILPILQAPWREQTSINGLILANNQELLKRLMDAEAALRSQEQRIAWLVGEVLKARNEAVDSDRASFRVVGDESLARAA